jgi:hypothetical protein
VWELASGTRRHSFKKAKGASFSPDGRRLAVAYTDFIEFHGRDVGTPRAKLSTGLLDTWVFPYSPAWSPNGKTLATVQEANIMIWHVPDLADRPVERKSSSKGLEMTIRWERLAHADAEVAFKDGIRHFLAVPHDAVPFLRKRLNGITHEKGRPAADLISDLASDVFEVRRKATAELERRGAAVEEALAGSLGKSPAIEVRRRLDAILAKCATLRGEHLQIVRGIEILEDIGSPEARQAIESLAKGPPESFLTQEARRVVVRLQRRRTT